MWGWLQSEGKKSVQAKGCLTNNNIKQGSSANEEWRGKCTSMCVVFVWLCGKDQ